MGDRTICNQVGIVTTLFASDFFLDTEWLAE